MKNVNFKMNKVYVYGDSISMQYGYSLKDRLEQLGIEYNRYGEGNSLDLSSPVYNGFSTNEMLIWIMGAKTAKDTILVFNCGLHDILHINPGDPCQVPIENYEKNLRRIIELAKEKFGNIIFCNTTPVDDLRHNRDITQRFRYNDDIKKYNDVSEGIMRKNGICMVDLYGITKRETGVQPIYIDHVHVTKHISELHTEAILAVIKECL